MAFPRTPQARPSCSPGSPRGHTARAGRRQCRASTAADAVRRAQHAPSPASINGEIGAPRAAAATPRCMSGRTWAPWRRRRDRPCPAPHWAIFLARGRRAPVVGQVARRINTPLRSLVRPCAHNALFVVCFQAPPTRLRPPCGLRDPNECARDSTRSPTSSMASGAILRSSLGPQHARSCA